MKDFIYFDHCGSTPLSAPVQKQLLDAIRENQFGNSSANHHDAGLAAAVIVEDSRRVIAEQLGCAKNQIVFTSGASEANNLVILGFWFRFHDRGCRVLYGATEHKSVLDACKQVGHLPNATAVEIPVDSSGVIDLNVLEETLSQNPKRLPTLVALMHTCNEIPVRHPVEEISQLCRKHKAAFHCDAVQGYVREKLDLSNEVYGSVVISPHKFYGPKGIGILAFSESPLKPAIVPPYVGGEQEFGLRPGTLNTLAIAGAGVALTHHENTRVKLLEHLKNCDRIFCDTMINHCPGFRLTVPANKSAPGIINFYIEDRDAPTLLEKLNKVCINRGASCTGAGGEKYSHVPRALGLPIEIQANVLRASFGWGCSLDEVKAGAEKIAESAK